MGVTIRNTLSVSAVVLLFTQFASCASVDDTSRKSCSAPGYLIDAHFDGGNFHRCHVGADGAAVIELRPENQPINPSPWYAFRVNAQDTGPMQLQLDFGDARPRYRPKISVDGRKWQVLDAARTAVDPAGSTLFVDLPMDTAAVWVSAQELYTGDWYDEWLRELAVHDEVTVQLLGSSVQGRPLYVAQSGDTRESVILLGRQHPPEVSGAIAMREFVSAVLESSTLAIEFRARFRLIVVPFLNPDGVASGYWRHNMNGVDLNRDWGPFTQPETAAVKTLLDALESAGVAPRLMLDFHSTRDTLFYTQMEDEGAGSPDFATQWLARARQRLPVFPFRHEPRPHSGQPNAKNYFFSRYGIPSITYELGDETDRQLIARSAPVFAEEMMQLLLEASSPLK